MIEYNKKENSLTLNGFDKGISDTPLSDFSNMRGINVQSANGCAGVNFKLQNTAPAGTPITFTANATIDAITLASLTFLTKGSSLLCAFTVSTTGTLPAGLAANTVYYWNAGDNTSAVSKVWTTIKGAYDNDASYIDITDTGTGTHTATPVLMGEVVSACQNPQGYIFAQDKNGRVWFNYPSQLINWVLIAGNTIDGTLKGCGIQYWKGFICVFYYHGIDFLADPISGLNDYFTWHLAKVTFTNNVVAFPFHSSVDDILYYYTGIDGVKNQTLGSLEEKIGQVFNPDNVATTANINNDCLDLPFTSQPTCINEIGIYLLIGTLDGQVYKWDRTSPSFYIPIDLPENNVSQLIVSNNTIYIFCGYSGRIYVSDATSFTEFKYIPDFITNYYYTNSDQVSYFKTAIHLDGKLIFSVHLTQGDSLICSLDVLTGVFIIEGSVSAGYNLGYTSSTGITGGEISLLLPINDKVYYAFWSKYSSGYTYGADTNYFKALIASGNPSFSVLSDYSALFESELVKVGDPYNKITFRKLEVNFLRPLTTGQGINIYYRQDFSSSYVLLKTIDFATYSGIKDIILGSLPFPSVGLVDLQLKVTMAGYNLTTPFLKAIKLHGEIPPKIK